MGKNKLSLETGDGLETFMRMLAKLEETAAKEAIDEALTKAAQKVSEDTHAAVTAGNLPARGRYSTGKTNLSVNDDTTPRWEGTVAWVPVGFDFSRPGAGGYLISGTPKMDPDPALKKMYRGKAYMETVQQEMFEVVSRKLQEAWEAGA